MSSHRPYPASSFPLQPHLFFPPPPPPPTLTPQLHLDREAHLDSTAAGEIQEILHSVSRLASGTGTPVTATAPDAKRLGGRGGGEGGEAGPLSADDLVSRLASRPQSPRMGLTQTRRRVPLKEWTIGQPMELIVLTGQRGGMVPFGRLPEVDGAIDLALHDLQCHPIASGYLLRFTLLEWDEVRLDRLMVSLKRSLREGAQARVQRTLLHDAFWSWRLQVTIHLVSPDASRQVLLVNRIAPAGLIAAL